MNKLAGWLSKLTNKIPPAPVHVTNEQILLLLDGEVSDSERRRIQRHLTDCWNCRFRCEEMQSAIHHMVECRNLVVDSRLDSDPPPSRVILAVRLQEQRELLSSSSHPAILWLANYRLAVLAVAACCVMLATAVFLSRKQPHPLVANEPTSAQEILHQAISAEREESVPAGQVRHRTMLLRIRNVTRAVEMVPRRVDIWDDSARHRSALVEAKGDVRADAQRVGGTGRRTAESAEERARSHSGERVPEEVLSRTLPTGFENLRVAEFSKLVAEPSQLSITRDKTIETLLYQPPKLTSVRAKQTRILLARLDLRSVDLHPIAEQLAVVSDSATWEFRLSEEADVDVPMADVPPGVFVEPVNPPSAVASGEPMAGAASLDEAIDVLTVLDGAGALTQQDVQLQRSTDGSLKVSGVVEDDVRRQALLQLLQSNVGRGLKLQIATVGEQSRQPRKARSLMVVEGGLENTSADTVLMGYFTNTLHLPSGEAEGKRVEIENQLLAWSSDAESQAEALHEVLSVAPQGKTEESSAQVRREWGALVQHHAAALRQDLAEIGKSLRPFHPNLDDPTCAIQQSIALTDPTELLSATRRISANVSNFVTPAGGGAQNSLLTTSFGCLLESTEQRASRLITPPPEP